MSDEQLRAVDKLKVVELKAQLSELGLPTSGLKADLAQRLKNHLISQLDNEPSGGSDETVEDSPKAPEVVDSSPGSDNAPDEDSAQGHASPVDTKLDPPSPGEPEPVAGSDRSSSTSNDENSNEPMETEHMEADSQPSFDDPSSRDEVQPPPVDEETVDSPPREPTVVFAQREEQSPMQRDEESSDQQVSQSPDQQLSRSPDQQSSRSPDQQVSQSPDQQVSRSPDQQVSQSPGQQVSRSPGGQEASQSPCPEASQSPCPEASQSPSQEASRSPYQDASRSSYPEASQSSYQDTSRSPYRAASRSPDRDESRSPGRGAVDSRSSKSASPPTQGEKDDSSQSNDAGADDDSQSKSHSMDEIIRKNLDLLEKAEKRAAKSKVQQILNEKGINLPTKQPGETKNQKKKRRKKTRRIMKNLNKEAGSDGESARDSERATDVEIEYVPDQVERDISWFQFSKVFEKFRFEEAAGKEKPEVKTEVPPVTDRLLERKKPADLSEDEDDEEKKDDGTTPKLSKKKLKQLTRMSVAELKIKVHHPELVEMHDVTAKDPVFLLTLKATRNSVPVPRHWCFKRKYLQGKRGIEKPPFDLPGFIKRTGICEMRAALQEKEEAKTLKSKQREKIRPKMGKIDIDYQKLHDAFFKWQTKPKLAMHGDLYYEGKEFETRLKEKKPGDLSDDLRTALGMPTGPNAAKCPPPWLIAMQRYGPPPSYPNLKIPGLNAPIPEGCSFGYHAGGWGKPPVDETGKPLYGDVFGLTAQESGVSQVEQDIDKLYLFGTMEEEESEEESEDEEEEEEESDAEEPDETGLVTPAEGLATPSGLQSSVSQTAEISDSIELRKRKIESEMEMGDQLPQLYQVLHEKKTDRIGHAMMGSVHTYDIPGQPAATKKGVELALDPSELEMDPGAMAARYEQTVREQQSQLAKEDFSDMVAEHAAKQKNKRKAREEAGAGGKKKYKEFKF